MRSIEIRHQLRPHDQQQMHASSYIQGFYCQASIIEVNLRASKDAVGIRALSARTPLICLRCRFHEKNCSRLGELNTLAASCPPSTEETNSWHRMNRDSWEIISRLVSMWKSDSSCRTNDVRPTSLLQKSTFSFIKPPVLKSPALSRAVRAFSSLLSSSTVSIR